MWFPQLTAEQFSWITAYGAAQDVREGDVLFRPRDPTYDLILIEAGWVEIQSPATADEPAEVIARYGPGGFLGELNLLTGQNACLIAQAVADGRIHRISQDQFRCLMADDPDISELLLRTFLFRRDGVRQVLGRAGAGDVGSPSPQPENRPGRRRNRAVNTHHHNDFPEGADMTETDELTRRNADFAATDFIADLSINPSGSMMVIGCVDPRVDPTHVLGIKQGEAGVIRNVGGRITPATLRTMVLLGKVGAANGGGNHPGSWNLIILHHTDCGMTDLAAFPDLLAEYFVIPADQLDGKGVSDPKRSVQVDVDVILDNIHASRYLVSGLVYDVTTGLVETVVPPTSLRTAGQAG